jgi:hypothetical protein
MMRWLIDAADASLWQEANCLDSPYLLYRGAAPVKIVSPDWRWIFRGGGE